MKRFDLLHTPLAGRNLIEASAGTGKTFTIAGVYLRLVLELGLEVGEILVVTFTEAATKELKERIRKRLKEAELAFEKGEASDPLLAKLIGEAADRTRARRLLSLAVRSFDEAAIFTIHGFCQRTLQENPFESGSLCDTELVTDQGSILREIARDYWRINCYYAPRPRVEAAQNAGLSPEGLLNLAKRVAADPSAAVIPDLPAETTEISAWLLALKRGFFDYLAAELPKRKQTRNVRSFDDLLIDLNAALKQKNSLLPALIRKRYRAALIDEFQDTDPTQFAIFDTIYPAEHPAPFFLIGDPKQAIYSFRGADIFAYMGAARATRERHTLLQNWRSHPRLIRGVNTLFASHPSPFLFESIPFLEVEAAQRELAPLTIAGAEPVPFKLWFAPRREPGKPINKGDANEFLPETVATEICRLLEGGAAGKVRIGERAVAPGDIAVLVRTNHQAKLVQGSLTSRGIPSVLCSTGYLFEAPEAAELLRVLSAVAEPGHEALLRGALATRMTGVTGDELAVLMADEAAWEEILDEFRGYHEIWAERGCMTMILRYLERRGVRERLLSLPQGERRLTNLLHLIETVHQAQVEGHLGMEGVISWLATRIMEKKEGEEHEIRLETDEAAVQLVTIHKSKGLEYPIVFAPFCWSEHGGRKDAAYFHDDSGRVVLDIGSEDLGGNLARADRETLAENLRLLYVALTRGKYLTYLAWGAFKDAGSGALHYLLHPEAAAGGQVALSDDEMIEELQRLAQRSDGAIEVVTLPEPDAARYAGDHRDASELSCREFTGGIERDWRVASFTSLATRSREHHELPDRDEATQTEAPDFDAPSSVPATGIFAFPKGAKAGIFLHEIFERMDFTAPAEELPSLVVELLDRHGFDKEWEKPVSAMVRAVLSAPLGEAGFKLADIPVARRFTELEFFFPLAKVSSDRLRNAIWAFTSQPLPVDLGALFDRLSFTTLKGMLRGFMDLVVEHKGRYYILDWKSNHLGNSVGEYGTVRMRREMEHHLYPLQYLLYTVALDNYLRLRLPKYDYDRHFGGIHYVFLRGVDGTGNGIFSDRPPKALIQELSAVLVGCL
ncbi:exodeoxyribonuclease V subunit beta [Geomesophilobacter sediminis]|uniref:DNA 3'-5' helicase n=1 Tax=Geomesophilobacter sediminis TaxID=2798584 RepID=A0A8J7S7D3_9BACT|nr:exodeoxyribonuclease V subunit beta [Geomesophilobacter sediminis]MBJ6726971.1 exodeoxyribonuclease V subunit beta [Geomesophilobacter sediminis]